MSHSYLGRDDFKTSMGDTTTRSDVAYRRALEAVSAQVDNWLGRTFRVRAETRYFAPHDPWVLDVDDLLAITALRLDQSNDRSYGTTFSTSDYELEPANAAADHRPYSAIHVAPQGSYRFSGGRRAVQIVGSWGYWQDLQPVGAVLSTTLAATSTSFQLASSTTLQPQQTILIGSEQIYLGELSTAGVASVERAVNGTVAAAHTSADAISVYRYPSPIVAACQLQTLRLVKRRDAPLGVVAGGLDIQEGVTTVIRFDPDVEQLLKTYRRYDYLAI